ncbi:uncharacterized protein [Dysidea avara]|uniref:uncharacterized protein n=1 Tax=Dysidea avara TaxID=196820 RepID=UPI00332724DB
MRTTGPHDYTTRGATRNRVRDVRRSIRHTLSHDKPRDISRATVEQVLNMKTCVFIGFLLFAVAASIPLEYNAPLLHGDLPEIVPDEYIVVFNSMETVSSQQVSSHMELIAKLMEDEETAEVVRSYNIGDRFRGYHAVMSNKILEEVRRQSEVKYVAHNREVHLAQTDCEAQPSPETWGLARTAQRERPQLGADYSYDPEVQGESVNAYIIDTGIEVEHPEFGGRAVWGADFIDGSNQDGNGHGTHVAGTVIGDNFGLARKATAIAVRVLNNGGSGSYAGVIAGVNYSANDHVEKKVPSVANMSLGGPVDQGLLDALEAAYKDGLLVVAAAGNSATDACNSSPAASDFATTVGAIDEFDTFAYFSNYGRCVEIQAPGVSIMSAYLNGGKAILSGTSMAAPHVAGVAAKLMGEIYKNSGEVPLPQDVEDELVKEATEGMINNLPEPGVTPNLIIFMECA